MAPVDPPDDLFDSGQFYGSPPKRPVVDEDDSVDYELESPDEDVIEGERRRAEADIEAARATVDINELYREEEGRDTDWSQVWSGFRFQYSTKHLLLLTAVAAVITAAITQTDVLTTIVLGALFCLAGGHAYLGWREHQRQQRVEVRRKQIYERARLARAGVPAAGLPPLESVEVPEPVVEQESFRFAPSRAELIATIAVSTVLFCLIYFVGSGSAALLLGVVALGGLVVHAVGFEPPGTVVLGWWLILVMYVVVSVLSAFRAAAS
jgi:hypothetical protein